MIRWVKNKVERLVLQGVHFLGREIIRHQDRQPAPSAWDMAWNSEGHLTVQGCDLIKLAEEFGTPLHIVDSARLEKDYHGFLKSFRAHYPHVEIGYSYKTNPLPGVLEELHRLGAMAEVISHFELWLALRLGVPPSRIIFNGPGKTEESLCLAVSRNILLINIDGSREIDVIDRLARDQGRVQTVGVRVVTSVGWSDQFGMSIRSGVAMDAIERIYKASNLRFRGLHIHLGTGIKNVQIYLQAIREVMDFSVLVERRLGMRTRYFDFGGGFGVPTVSPFSRLDLKLLANKLPVWTPHTSVSPGFEEYGRAVGSLFRQYHSADQNDPPTILFEPGRAVTSSAQSLLLRVIATKRGENDVETVILDGGRNLVLPPMWEHHGVFVASKANSPRERYYNLYGPLCHPGDLLFRAKWLPRVEIGDVIAILDTGAYFIPNQMNFSNPRPAVVMVAGGRPCLIRERESFENVISLDHYARPIDIPGGHGKG